MARLTPADSSPLEPKQEDLDHVLQLFKLQNVGALQLSEIIKQSKLTRTKTLRSLEVLIDQGLVVKDDVRSVFYLL